MTTTKPTIYSIGATKLGRCLVVSSTEGIEAIWLADTDVALESEVQKHFLGATKKRSEPTHTQLRLQLDSDTKIKTKGLVRHGTDLQQAVWQALSKIPVGKTMTYKELAKTIGRPKAVRAVANAVGANQHAVVVPCHRVVRSDGTLGGYRWGLKRKQQLLKREGAL